jgi:hypothetical protein
VQPDRPQRVKERGCPGRREGQDVGTSRSRSVPDDLDDVALLDASQWAWISSSFPEFGYLVQIIHGIATASTATSSTDHQLVVHVLTTLLLVPAVMCSMQAAQRPLNHTQRGLSRDSAIDSSRVPAGPASSMRSCCARTHARMAKGRNALSPSEYAISAYLARGISPRGSRVGSRRTSG